MDDTRIKLDVTITEMNERRQNIHVLADQIGVLNGRVADMGTQLSELDQNIARSHKKLDELFVRIQKLRAPSPKLDDSIDNWWAESEERV